MPKIIAVVGTDTGIGKTWVGCRLGAALATASIRVRAIKLLESGTTTTTGAEEDGVLLAAATGQASPTEALQRFRAAVAPSAAAELEGATLNIDSLIDRAFELAADCDICLLEGAGGLVAPLSWSVTMLEVIRRHQLLSVVVCADQLGTINHTMLTLNALSSSGNPALGVIMNRLPEVAKSDQSVGQNGGALIRMNPTLRVAETSQPGWESTVLGWLSA